MLKSGDIAVDLVQRPGHSQDARCLRIGQLPPHDQLHCGGELRLAQDFAREGVSDVPERDEVHHRRLTIATVDVGAQKNEGIVEVDVSEREVDEVFGFVLVHTAGPLQRRGKVETDGIVDAGCTVAAHRNALERAPVASGREGSCDPVEIEIEQLLDLGSREQSGPPGTQTCVAVVVVVPRCE